jgi:hypothetical protein
MPIGKHMYFVVKWYISPLLVYFIKKNLATLLFSCAHVHMPPPSLHVCISVFYCRIVGSYSAFEINTDSNSIFPPNQGDQIGGIFASRVIVSSGSFFKKLQK